MTYALIGPYHGRKVIFIWSFDHPYIMKKKLHIQLLLYIVIKLTRDS